MDKNRGVQHRQREEARKFEALQTVGAPIIKEDLAGPVCVQYYQPTRDSIGNSARK